MPRPRRSHKYDYGHTLVFGGSRAMPGAAILTATAALDAGSGLVSLAYPKGIAAIEKKLPAEVMRIELPITSKGSVAGSALGPIQRYLKNRRVSCVAVGPGLSTEPAAAQVVRALVRISEVPVVLDADGINAWSGHLKGLKDRHTALVLTPHGGEFKRLFGRELPPARTLRIKLAKKLSRFYDVVLVLKGPRTLVVFGDRVYENHTGNPGLAKGGSGDVLTGLIAAFISQGLAPYAAAAWAVYLHGRAADIAVKSRSELSLRATDILKVLPKAFLKYS